MLQYVQEINVSTVQRHMNSLEDDGGGIVMVGLGKVELSAEGFLETHGRQVLELELWKAVQINS